MLNLKKGCACYLENVTNCTVYFCVILHGCLVVLKYVMDLVLFFGKLLKFWNIFPYENQIIPYLVPLTNFLVCTPTLLIKCLYLHSFCMLQISTIYHDSYITQGFVRISFISKTFEFWFQLSWMGMFSRFFNLYTCYWSWLNAELIISFIVSQILVTIGYLIDWLRLITNQTKRINVIYLLINSLIFPQYGWVCQSNFNCYSPYDIHYITMIKLPSIDFAFNYWATNVVQ